MRPTRRAGITATGQGVPIFEYVLYGLLCAGAVVGVASLGAYGALPMTTLLDAWIGAFALIAFVRNRMAHPLLLVLLSGYALTRVIGVMLSDSPLSDSLQAYRWLLYLIVLLFVAGRRWVTPGALARVSAFIIWCALLKALLTRVMLGPGERPGLFLENNFELALFCGLVAVSYRYLRHPRLTVVALGALTLLAESRSGVVVYAALVAVLVFATLRGVPAVLAGMAGTAVVSALVFYIFAIRVDPEHGIDRINFLNVFWREVADWSFLDWITGTWPISPLSTAGCRSLAFYEGLFSSTGDGSCYSVILHAFLLRVVFDAGLIGLFLSVIVPALVLLRRGTSRLLVGYLLFVCVANGMSVSGINNPYVVLPIFLAAMLADWDSVGRRSSLKPRSHPGEPEADSEESGMELEASEARPEAG